MLMRLTVQELIDAAKELSPPDLHRLVEGLTSDSLGPKRHVTELRGLGKEIWQGLDAQAHIRAERDSWPE